MRSPVRLRRLVLVAPALRLGPAGEAPSCQPVPDWVGLLLGRRDVRSVLIAGTASYPAFSEDLLGRFVHRKEAVTPERVAAYQLPMRRFSYSADIGDWAYAFAGAGCEPSASLDPAKITAWAQKGPPVVLIWGTADSITPIVQARSLLRWMPEARLTELPDVGHIPHIEDPGKLAAALLEAIGPAPPPPRAGNGAARGTSRKERRP
jgi:pimeloyl-ACP methyl ester carboxylesterase